MKIVNSISEVRLDFSLILWSLGIGLIVGVIPGLVLGLLAHGRGYSIYKYTSYSIALFALPTAVLFALNSMMVWFILVLCISAVSQILYLVLRMKKKYLKYQRETIET